MRVADLVTTSGSRLDAVPFPLDRKLRYVVPMGVKTLGELRAWQHVRAFKLEVYRLVKGSQAATSDHRYRSQLMNAAAAAEANVAEGFRRFVAGDFARFLVYASASIEEALSWLQDGVDRGYFALEDCHEALRLGSEAGKTVSALRSSLSRFVRKRRSGPTDPSTHTPPPTPRTKDRGLKD